MQPQSAHGGQTCVAGFAHQRVIVRQQAIAQLQIFPADRFHLGIVQFGGVGDIARFERARAAGVPAKGPAQVGIAAFVCYVALFFLAGALYARFGPKV